MTNLATQSLMILFNICLCSPIGLNDFRKLVIWNVGQGSWSTLRQGQTCYHFDAGGEKAPLRKIAAFCENRKNILFLSHDDFDHIRYSGWLAHRLKACWSVQIQLKKIFRRVKTPPPTCTEQDFDSLLIYAPAPELVLTQKNANLQSLVYISNHVLFPGDAPATSERIWNSNPQISSVRYLILGHHGSRTSTSQELLAKISDLKMAFASARRHRYGHPHAETLWRLRQHHTPVLTSEDWGNIELRL